MILNNADFRPSTTSLVHDAGRKPLYMLHPVNRQEVADARKRVAAKRYLRRYSTLPQTSILELPTKVLVTLCKAVRDCPELKR